MVHSLLNKVILSKSFLIDTVLIGKDSVAGRDWGQKEKGMTENEMAGWHHWLDGCESERTPGVGDGQGGLACCDSWGHKESDTTERLNWTVMNLCLAWWECIFLLQNLYWGKLAFIKSNMDRRYFPIGFCVCVCVCVCVLVAQFVTQSTVVLQAPLFLRFPGQEYWGQCHFLI